MCVANVLVLTYPRIPLPVIDRSHWRFSHTRVARARCDFQFPTKNPEDHKAEANIRVGPDPRDEREHQSDDTHRLNQELSDRGRNAHGSHS